MTSGVVAAADGTVAPVALLAGAKIQVAVVIVFNSGEVVDLVTRVVEHELATGAPTATEYFARLRKTRKTSYLVSHAIMLFGERTLLMEQASDWRMLHGELIPHELRTGAGRPADNLPATFDLIGRYIGSERFLACDLFLAHVLAEDQLGRPVDPRWREALESTVRAFGLTR